MQRWNGKRFPNRSFDGYLRPVQRKARHTVRQSTCIGDYARKIMINNVSPSEFHDVPVLATIEPADFVGTLIALDPTAQSRAFSAFKGRYERGLLTKELASERPWLESVRAELTTRIPSLPPMSRFRLKNLAGRNIDPFLHKDYDT
jgi:hypothetical protein